MVKTLLHDDFWSISGAEELRRARALQVILLVWVAFLLIVPVQLRLAALTDPTSAAYYSRLSSISCLIQIAAYLLSRTRFYMWGAALCAVVGLGGVVTAVSFAPSDEVLLNAVGWLALAPVVCSMFLPLTAFICYCAIAIIWLITLPLIHDGITWLVVLGVAIPYGLLMTLLGVNIYLRRQDLRQLEQERMLIVRTEKMTALGELSASIAHEINNPLAIIQGHASKIVRLSELGRLDQEGLQELTSNIKKTTLRIARIIDGLRVFTRDVREDDAMVPTELKEIINATVDLVATKFRHLGVPLVTEGEAAAIVLCHETHLSQVLLNLLTNALDAVQKAPVNWVRIQIERPVNDFVDLVVVDSGKGIPKKIRQRMMEPFFTTKAAGSGTGIGLSISRMLVQRHGGSLFYDDRREHTAFVVRLPLYKG